MVLIILNAFLYIALLLLYWRKTKNIDCGFLLISVWVGVAVCAVFLYLDKPSDWLLTFWPFFYLFLAFLLFSRMYIFSTSKTDYSIKSFVYKKNKILDVVCYLFIIFSVINIINTDFSSIYVSMEDMERYAMDNYETHIDNIGKKAYTNFLERISLNYCSWFKVVVLIGMYNALCQKRNSFSVCLALSIFIPTFINSMMMGTRGTLFSEIILFISAYVLYKKYIPTQIKSKIYFGASITIVLSLIFITAVTNSRFSNTDMGSGGSVLWYFGQSMLYFDNGLADSVDGSFLGARTFKTLYPLFGLKMPISLYADMYLGTSFGTNFTTFIGMLILDFGFIGTLAIGLLLPWLIEKMCFYKKSFTFASLYLYLFFLNRLIFGVFTNASGADFQYIIAFLLYFIFRFIFDAPNVDLQLQSKKNNLWN